MSSRGRKTDGAVLIMLRRRLRLQIYLTIIASLVMVVVLSGLMWDLFGRDRIEGQFDRIVGRFVALSLPPANAPDREQDSAIDRLGSGLDVDVSLYDREGRLIGSHGPVLNLPRHFDDEPDWRRTNRGRAWVLELEDGLVVVADPTRGEGPNPLIGLLLFLTAVAAGVGLAAYPFVRRLTRRLEELQQGVERIGAGDLSARVAVRGRDEVARLAESFNESAEKVEKLVGAHRMLLANASHELRTPLSRIRLGLEMTAEGRDPKREAALRRDIAELDSLIDEILLMSRLDADARIDLNQTVDLVALAAEECARYDDCELSGTAPEIRGDPRLLHRVMANLLENAFKHGAPPVSVNIAAQADAVTLTVSDGGMGIRDADREKVFQAFYRGSDRQNIEGYGLGLPLVRQIVESHGGTATIVPKEEARSAIRITLPIDDTTQPD